MIYGRATSLRIGTTDLMPLHSVEVHLGGDTSELEAALEEAGRKVAEGFWLRPFTVELPVTEANVRAIAYMFRVPAHLLYPSVRARRAWKLYGQRR